MLPSKEFTVLDINAEHLGVPTSLLMENAGAAAADVVRRKFGKGKRIIVLCGSGNNGGDGFVAARHLRDDNEVQIILAKPPRDIHTNIARDAFEIVKDMVVDGSTVHLFDYDLIVDALLGTGVEGRIGEPYRGLITRINECIRPVVSIDVPSGLGGDVMVDPDVTVTFHDVKEGMTKENSGQIVVRDIGIPKEAEEFIGPGEFAYYPIPSPDSHKGMNGRVLIIGGGPFTGAPALAGFGAFGIKVDLVHIATPERSYMPIASYSPNFIVHSLPGDHLVREHVPLLKKLSGKADAVLIGPGLGDDEGTYAAAREFVRSCKLPLVIDADGIGAVAQNLKVLKGRSGVVTPHAKEFEELSGVGLSDDYEARARPAMKLAKQTGFTVLVKGRLDVVASATRCKFAEGGNAGMSVGGTGDVLAGAVAGLLSRGVEPFNAARMAALANKRAGDLAYGTRGFGLLATNVAWMLPKAIKPLVDRFL
jgi:NAD(P)H-hydrate epimerase